MKPSHMYRAKEDTLVLVNSKEYKGVAIFCKYNLWEDVVYVRSGTFYYAVSPREVVRFLPKGNLTESLYGK